MKKDKAQPKPEIKLNEQELRLISQALFNSRWSGPEWKQTITPLINKLAQMIDQLKKQEKTLISQA